MTSILSTDQYGSFASVPESEFEPECTESISTEDKVEEHPEWKKCIDAMLAKLSIVNCNLNSSDDGPNTLSITNALKWLQVLRSKYPQIPPTCIVPEPGGGIIIQRISVTFRREWIAEFTLYNNGTAEYCRYESGKVVELKDIPAVPKPGQVYVS